MDKMASLYWNITLLTFDRTCIVEDHQWNKVSCLYLYLDLYLKQITWYIDWYLNIIWIYNFSITQNTFIWQNTFLYKYNNSQ